MRALCEKHNLVVAGDGQCVVCRRPPGTVLEPRVETVESLLSKIVNGILLLGLLGAIGAMAYLTTLPEPYSGPKLSAGVAPNADTALATVRPTVLSAEPEQAPPDELKTTATPAPTEPIAPTEAPAAAQPKPETSAPPMDLKTRYAARARVPVTLYTAEWCFVCDQARDYLSVRGVTVHSLDIEADATAAQRLLKFNKAGSLPSFEVAGTPVIGFNAVELEATIDRAVSTGR